MKQPWLGLGTVAVLLPACGDDAAAPDAAGTTSLPSRPPDTKQPSPPGARYAAVVTVIEETEGAPRMCFGVADSLPPQCDDSVVREVVGLDWNAVPDAESSDGTTWADLRLVGTWDGTARRFTLTEPPTAPARSSGADVTAFDVPCPEPDGGWERPDDQGQVDAGDWLQGRPDISATWLAAPDGRPQVSVLVVRVAEEGTPAETERAVRRRYSGPLCVISSGRPEAELLAVLTASEDVVGEDQIDGFLDVVAGHVVITVMLATPEVQAVLDARFGEGTVVLESALEPVE